MAHHTRDRHHHHEEPVKPAHAGDILGLSDAPPDVEIPRATADRGGHPQGIDVRTPATGIDELNQGPGATGIDMGYAGEGTNVTDHPRRPKAAEPVEDEETR
jgi:hypothetical protein